jgi:mycothiol synthase
MVELATERGPETVAAVRALLDDAADARGGRPLSDEHWLALTSGAPGAIAVVARDDGAVVAFAQAVPGNDAYSVELVVRPGIDVRSVGGDVLTSVLHEVRAAGGAHVHFWRSSPTAEEDELARSAGLVPSRRLLQMRRALPTGLRVEVGTRPFRPGVDEEAWLAVNNRAFADHPEQGGWTHDALARREAEPWFDPDGFRLHERDGRLAAFCWTKLHHDQDPMLGEIYVIAVDPDFQGLGLGRQLTLAGLDSIAARGVGLGMLYVDESNAGAVALYEGLGFTLHHADVAYTAELR